MPVLQLPDAPSYTPDPLYLARNCHTAEPFLVFDPPAFQEWCLYRNLSYEAHRSGEDVFFAITPSSPSTSWPSHSATGNKRFNLQAELSSFLHPAEIATLVGDFGAGQLITKIYPGGATSNLIDLPEAQSLSDIERLQHAFTRSIPHHTTTNLFRVFDVVSFEAWADWRNLNIRSYESGTLFQLNASPDYPGWPFFDLKTHDTFDLASELAPLLWGGEKAEFFSCYAGTLLRTYAHVHSPYSIEHCQLSMDYRYLHRLIQQKLLQHDDLAEHRIDVRSHDIAER